MTEKQRLNANAIVEEVIDFYCTFKREITAKELATRLGWPTSRVYTTVRNIFKSQEGWKIRRRSMIRGYAYFPSLSYMADLLNEFRIGR